MHVIVHLVRNVNWNLSMFIDWNPIETQGVCVLIVTSSSKHVLKSFPKVFIGLKCLERLYISLEGVNGDLGVKRGLKRGLPGPPRHVELGIVEIPRAESKFKLQDRGVLDMSSGAVGHVERDRERTLFTPFHF